MEIAFVRIFYREEVRRHHENAITGVENKDRLCPIKTPGGSKLFCNCPGSRIILGIEEDECRQNEPCPTSKSLFPG